MFGTRKARRILGLFLTLTLLLSVSVSSFAQGGAAQKEFTAIPLTPDSTYNVTVAKDGPVREPTAPPVTSEGLVSVIVKLEDASLAAYTGGVPGLAPTNPRAIGQKKLNPTSAASKAYLNYLEARQKAFFASAKQAIPAAKLTGNFEVLFGGVSMLVPEADVGRLSSLPGVKAVYPDEIQYAETETSPYFIGADSIWDMLGGQEDAGEGVTVGVIDSGIWPEHPSFSDPDVSGKPYDPPAVIPGSNGVIGTHSTCDFGDTAYNPDDAPFTCNNKLIGAYAFIDTSIALGALGPDNFDSARDDDGHGTHTSSTAAGNANVPASIFDIPRGNISGMAPRAHIIMYRALVEGSGYSSDLMRAAQQATLDQVDALNYSISGGSNPFSDAVSLAFLDAYEAGVFVAASAGNSGPGLNTTDHREPWTTTVGASTTDRQFQSTITLVADNDDTLELVGASITHGIDTPTPVIFPPAGQEMCNDPFPAGTFDGQIVICERGVIARVTKSYNVWVGGAGGMFLYNPSLQGLATDNYFLPGVQLEVDQGDLLLDFMDTHTGVMGTFTQGTAVPAQGDVMASFSSRGGPGQNLGVSKPDVTAPGVQILAGMMPDPLTPDGGRPGQFFQVIQGTSMSAPHVAGAGALLKALHPDWTPGQIKSALMTTAKTEDVVEEDGTTPANPFDYGSGRIDLTVAGDPGCTFDASGTDYVALQSHLWDANYPSLYVPSMPGFLSVNRTLHNVTDRNICWSTMVESPSDLMVTISPKICVRPNGDKTFPIAVDASAVPIGEYRFATVTFQAGNRMLHFPITIVRREPAVSLTKECDPGIFPKGAVTDCTISMTNNSFDEAMVSLVDRLPTRLKMVRHSVFGAMEAGNQLFFNGSLYGAEPPDVTVTYVENGSPAGYLPLSGFGIAPISGVGDETIVNFSGFGSFVYAGQTWTRIGMTSDGYAVVGGGTGADVQFINQDLPDPTRPNNVLASFWTDLNPESGGELRAGILAGGGLRWLVFDWEGVPNWSDPAAVNDFQIWVGLNGVEDISFTYGPNLTDGDGGYLTVGAENEYGNRGENFYFDGAGTLPTPGLDAVLVYSVPGEPGETHVITFSAQGYKLGAWTNCAVMSSNLFDGVATACFSGEVTQ